MEASGSLLHARTMPRHNVCYSHCALFFSSAGPPHPPQQRAFLTRPYSQNSRQPPTPVYRHHRPRPPSLPPLHPSSANSGSSRPIYVGRRASPGRAGSGSRGQAPSALCLRPRRRWRRCWRGRRRGLALHHMLMKWFPRRISWSGRLVAPPASNSKVTTFRSGEVNDVAVFFEHVHLLDGLDGLDVELF